MIEKDLKILQKACNKAKKVDPHQVCPNPRVGCIIVKNNKLLAQGVHEKYGKNHAEKNALEKLKKTDIKGSTIYITLEPCDRFEGKKTPSCTDLIIAAQPKKIVVGNLDPQFMGKNLEKIKKSGIEVVCEEQNLKNNSLNQAKKLNDDLKKLNPFFGNFITQKKPFITLKIAQSLDGKITNYQQKKRNISSSKSRQRVMEMRARYTALLTTTQTILKDNPKLNIRNISSQNLGFKNYSDPDLIILGKQKIPKNFNIFKIHGREIFFFETLEDFLKSGIYKKNDSILTECGGTMNRLLLEKKIVNRIEIFLAPKIIGNKNSQETSSFSGTRSEFGNLMKNFKFIKSEIIDSDVRLLYKSEKK